MKVSMNVKFLNGPYGGGMQFSNTFKNFLIQKNISVVNTLHDNDIDIILHIAPLPFQEICSYSYAEAFIYKLKHPKTNIVLRINECDERKNTHYMNQAFIRAAKFSDSIVFISEYLKRIFTEQGIRSDITHRVIRNGADTNIFNSKGKIPWNRQEKLKIVTHHWGANVMKGHDAYQELDAILSRDASFREKFEFTFIGNIPSNIRYSQTKTLLPLSGTQLAEELKKHHVYITATRNEPAGMHHIEGALCGLPILYINSGALPEYCSDFGILFEKRNLRNALLDMYDSYEKQFDRILQYPNTAEKMCREFLELFIELENQSKKTKSFPRKKTTFGQLLKIQTEAHFHFLFLRMKVYFESLKKMYE